MAKKKTTKTTKSTKKDPVVDEQPADISDTASDHITTDVAAAYWDEKVKKSASLDSISKTAKNVEDYVSNIMVVAKPNESSEQLLRRFNREVRDLNLMDDIRERLEYEKPSQKRKRLKREKYLASKRKYWE